VIRLLLPRLAQVRAAALRQRLVDLNLALHIGPPVLTFFDLPPEQDFLQGQWPTAVGFRFVCDCNGYSSR
jgi:hypothetical protein